MLHHVSLELSAADADRFGEMLELIGWEGVTEPDALAGSVRWYERGSTQIHLICTEHATAPPLGHAALAVDDYERSIERLRARGFEVEPSRPLWGSPRAFVHAPGGHRIELMATPPPPSTADN